jgi:transcription antitermination factor NusG
MSTIGLIELPNLDAFTTTVNAQLDPQWHVLHTRSRQDKILARELCAEGTTCYLPLVMRAKMYSGYMASVEVPLFPGYVFLRGTLDEVERAQRTGRVASIVRVRNHKRFVWELRNLYMALSVNNDPDPYPAPKTGMRVEVTSGPLMGVQGLIEDDFRDRLILLLKIVRQAVSVKLNGAIVSELGVSFR